jgi:hypothetical protein
MQLQTTPASLPDRVGLSCISDLSSRLTAVEKQSKDTSTVANAYLQPLQAMAANQQQMSAALDALVKQVKDMTGTIDTLVCGALEGSKSRQQILKRLDEGERLLATYGLRDDLVHRNSHIGAVDHPHSSAPAAYPEEERPHRGFEPYDADVNHEDHKAGEQHLRSIMQEELGRDETHMNASISRPHPSGRGSEAHDVFACDAHTELGRAEIRPASTGISQHTTPLAAPAVLGCGVPMSPRQLISDVPSEAPCAASDTTPADSAGNSDIGGELTRWLEITHEDEVVAGAVRLLEVAPPPVVRMAASALRFAQAHGHEFGLGDLQVIEYANDVALLILRGAWQEHAEGLGPPIDQAKWATLLHRSMRTQLEELADRRYAMNRDQFRHTWQQMLVRLDSMLANAWQSMRGT